MRMYFVVDVILVSYVIHPRLAYWTILKWSQWFSSQRVTDAESVSMPWRHHGHYPRYSETTFLYMHLLISGDPSDLNLTSVARFKKWVFHSHRENCPGKYQTVVRSICLIGVDLLPNVTRSMALFANKLDIKNQPVALECLHDWVWDRVVNEYRNPNASNIDVSYYRELEFVQKHFTL